MEFTSEPFQQLLVLDRIKHEWLAPYSRDRWMVMANFIFYSKVSSKLPQNLWVYALMASAYIKTQEKSHMKVLLVQNQT